MYHDDDDAMTETDFNPAGNRAAVWGRYLPCMLGGSFPSVRLSPRKGDG